MNIIEYWQQVVQGCDHPWEYDKEDFLEELDEKVPGWKEQVRKRSNWPHFHLQGDNPEELELFSVILEEAGLEFALQLIEKHDDWNIESDLALELCASYAGTEWDSYSETLKDQLLETKLNPVLPQFQEYPELWCSLSPFRKRAVMDKVLSQEQLYVADLMLYTVWSDELQFKELDHLHFATRAFQNAYDLYFLEEETPDEVDHFDETATNPFQRAYHLQLQQEKASEEVDLFDEIMQSWEVPELVPIEDGKMKYVPSYRIMTLRFVTELADDDENTAAIKKTINQLQLQYGR